MKIETGQLNGRILALLGVLVTILLGYSWWQYLYTPAVTKRESAKSQRDSAAQSLEGLQKRLADAKAAQSSLTDKSSDDGKQIGRIQVAKTAIPRGDTVLPAIMQVERLIKLSGVSASIGDISESQPAVSGSGGGTSTSATLQVTGHASFASLLAFIREINDTARVYRGKIYISDRLLRVAGLSIETSAGAGSDASAGTGGTSSTSGSDTDQIPRNHVKFTMTIMYFLESTEAVDTSQSASAAGTQGSTTGAGSAPGTGTSQAGTGTGQSGTGSGTGTNTSMSGAPAPSTGQSGAPAPATPTSNSSS